MIGEYDAIVVPGGGLKQTGELADRNYARLETALFIFKLGIAKFLLMTGGSQIGADEGHIPEAQQLKQEAIARGIDENFILTEQDSRDTIGNALNVADQLVDQHDIKRVLLVTHSSHSKRCKKAFEMVLGEEYEVDVFAIPERHATWNRAKSWGGFLTMKHIFRGVNPGDRDAIRQRLAQDVPGYGNELADLKKLHWKGFFELFLPPVVH